MSASTTQKVQLAIKAAPEEVWAALTDGEITPSYYVGFRAEIDPTAGAAYRYTADGADVITGTVLRPRPADASGPPSTGCGIPSSQPFRSPR